MEHRNKIRSLISRNVQRVMRNSELTKQDVAKRGHISTRMIQMVLSEERTPSAEILDAIGEGLGMPGWLLMSEYCPEDVNAAGMANQLLKQYAGLNPHRQALAVSMLQALGDNADPPSEESARRREPQGR